MTVRLLARPHCVALNLRVPGQVALTRVVAHEGVILTEVVSGRIFLTIQVRVYSDTIFIDTTVYPSLMVVRLFV